MAETPPLKRIEDLPLGQKLKLLLVAVASVGGGVLLAMSSPKTKAVGMSLLFLIAMPVAAVKFIVCTIPAWRSGRRMIALLYALLALLFALLALAAVSWFLDALALAAESFY